MDPEDLQVSLQYNQDECQDLLEKLLDLDHACGVLRAASILLKDRLRCSGEDVEDPNRRLREELSVLLGCLKQSERETAAIQEQLKCLEEEKKELRSALQELTTKHLNLSVQHAQCFQRLKRTKAVLRQLQAVLANLKEEGDAALKEFHQERQSATKLARALQEQSEIKKIMRKKSKCLWEIQESLQQQTAGAHNRWKVERRTRLSTSLLQEMVTVKLEEQLVTERHGINFWLQRPFVLLACLQLALLCLLLLQRNSRSWEAPRGLASSFGSCPAWPEPF